MCNRREKLSVEKKKREGSSKNLTDKPAVGISRKQERNDDAWEE